MKVWKDKSGKWIDAKEFKQRFLAGVEGVSPLQQVKSQMFFTWITIIGILCGISVSLYRWSTLWWLCIVLLAGLGNTIIGQIGIYQKYKTLAHVEEMMKQNEAFFSEDNKELEGGKEIEKQKRTN